MPDLKWDGKLYRPMKFGEGLQPETVESERRKRQRRAQMEYWCAVGPQTAPPVPETLVVKFLRTLFRRR